MDVLDLEGIDDDLELETELQVEAMETDLDRPMSRLSVMPDTVGPNSNELRLGKRVLDLEKERDSLAAELKAMKAKYAPPTSTTLPVLAGPPEEKQEIPHALLPILDVMRHHISELTRDNQAMRYTFGLDSTTSNPTSDGHLAMDPRILEKQGLDLQAVIERVRALVKENEELGDMVIEAGRVDTAEWERALEDSQKVITSLDADLQHHAETVQKLRQELETYKVQSPSATVATPRAGPSRDLLSPPPRPPGGSQDGRHRGGQRDDRRHDSRRGHGQGQGHRDDRSGNSGQRDRDRDRDRDRNRDREKERIVPKEKEGEKAKDKPPGLSIRGASGGGSDFGPIPRREDDRATKRRK